MEAPLLILYGSQTGNAQDVAERLAREARILRFQPRCIPMDAYDVTQLPQEQLAVFVASTTGQGNQPDNMRRFWRFLLRKSLPPDSLSHMQFAVFGLGDSGYPSYNVVAKKLFRRLESLGATPLLALGLGDDQHASGYEAGLDPWLSDMWPRLRAAAGPLPTGVQQPALDEASQLHIGEPRFCITLLPPDSGSNSPPAAKSTGHDSQHTNGRAVSVESSDLQWQRAVDAFVGFQRVAAAAAGYLPSEPQPSGIATSGEPQQVQVQGVSPGSGPRYGPWRPYLAPLRANQRITAAEHFQDTRHIELDIAGSGMRYEPGDVLAVLPRTPDKLVATFLSRLGLEGGQRVRVSVAPGTGHPGQHSQPKVEATVWDLVQGALDVGGASPRRHFFQVLHAFTPEGREKERLAYFATAEGRDDLYRYNQREGRTVVEVLADFPSASPPLEWLLEVVPPLRPRHFSIASSLSLHPGQAHLLVALVQYTTPYNRVKKGLCSTYLSALTPSAGDRVACWVEQGSLRMPAARHLPLLMVGPGTGVAPFRAFLQERKAWALQQQTGDNLNGHADPSSVPQADGVVPGTHQDGTPANPPTPCHLFFGCRSSGSDFYYEEEWLEMQADGVLAPPPMGLVTAFSREQPTKVYVTHCLRELGAHVWRLLESGARVYVAGSANKMPADVAAALAHVAEQHGGLGQEEAKAYVRQLELKGRYSVEAWS